MPDLNDLMSGSIDILCNQRHFPVDYLYEKEKRAAGGLEVFEGTLHLLSFSG